MTKDQIIKTVAEESGISQKKAKVALNAALEAITDALTKKEKVTFVGFGTFQVVHKQARKGKNPKTMQVINIPAKNVPVFKAGKKLKSFVK